MQNDKSPAVQTLKRPNAPDLAYRYSAGDNDLPVIVFLGGFRSDMEGTKASFFEAKAKARGQGYLRFDYRGHGRSGGDFAASVLSDWVCDALDIITHCTSFRPLVLVGSSMGGWISLILAQNRDLNVRALVGLAAAPDFTQWMEQKMSAAQRQELADKGFFDLPNDYAEPYRITKALLDDGRKNSILDKKLDFDFPVRLIQGKKDADVPWQTAHQIEGVINGKDVKLSLLNEADHRLSAPDELEHIESVISAISS